MHQIDIGVRFQEVAPSPLARMRLAGYQQHPQFLTDTFDRNDRAIVRKGQFIRQPFDFQFDYIGAAMLDANVDGKRACLACA